MSDPCTGEKSQKEKEQAAAVAGATTSYEGFLAEFNRVTKVGGADQATAAMSRYAAGPYLKAYVGFIKDIKSAKERYSGDVVSRRFVLSGGESRTDAPNDMVFNFCQDGLQNKVYDASGNVIDHGSVISGKMYVRQVAGSWKLWDTTDSQGTKC